MSETSKAQGRLAASELLESQESTGLSLHMLAQHLNDLLNRGEDLSTHNDSASRLAAVKKIIDGYSANELFVEVGKLTRKIHDSINGFQSQLSPTLGRLAHAEVPEASNKLQSVIDMTNAAAHTVLEHVEKQEQVFQAQKALTEEFTARLLAAGNQRGAVPWEKEIEEFRSSMLALTSNAEQSATAVLMAQEFQDISGQTLNKVIKLITEVEGSLVLLVKMFGLKPEEQSPDASQSGSTLVGPSSNGCNQDDIDDLLGSLGF